MRVVEVVSDSESEEVGNNIAPGMNLLYISRMFVATISCKYCTKVSYVVMSFHC